MDRYRLSVLLVLGSLLVLSFPPTPATGAEPAITNVTVSPGEPQPGEIVRFTTTVRNSEGADGSFEVTSVWIRQAGSTREYARVSDPGNVPPGSTLEIPLTARFDSPGIKDLRVRVNTVDENDELTQLQYPVTVVVSGRGTQLSIDVEDAVAGERTTVNVSVSNGGSNALRQLDLRLAGGGAHVERPRRLLARLESGQDRTFPFDVTFTDPGEASLSAVLEYTTTAGQTRTVRRDATVAVDALREDVSVDARVAEGGGASPSLSVEVTNFGNARLEDVRLRVVDGDRTVGRRLVGAVEAGDSRQVRVNVSGVDAAPLDVTAEYETGGRSGEAGATVRYATQPGRIQLTGVDFSREGGVVTITGSASNVGLSEVNSVVLQVLPAPGVDPVPPSREYFVGTVQPSDFISFDLTATVSENATSIPVEVTYLVDGIPVTESTSIAYDPVANEAEPTDQGGWRPSSSSLLVGGGLVVAAGLVVWWRRRRGGG